MATGREYDTDDSNSGRSTGLCNPTIDIIKSVRAVPYRIPSISVFTAELKRVLFDITIKIT